MLKKLFEAKNKMADLKNLFLQKFLPIYVIYNQNFIISKVYEIVSKNALQAFKKSEIFKNSSLL